MVRMESRHSVPRLPLAIGLAAVAASLLSACGPSQACANQHARPSASVHTLAPPPRAYEAMAEEGASGRLILYGGESPEGALLSDTWLWDGQTWSEHLQSMGPRIYWPMMTFDSARGQVVLIGSTIYDPTRGPSPTETWLWRNGSWRQVHPSTAPKSYGLDSSIADDASISRVLLYADIPRGYGATHEMWSWDGQNWTSLPLPTIVYYAAPRWIAPGPNGGVLGLGKNWQTGDGKGGAVYEWTGHDWKALNATGMPAAVRAQGYDPVRHRLVVMGSLTGDIPDVAPPSDTTFTFDGRAWSATALPAELRGRVNFALAWYGGACTLVLWGGMQGQGLTFLPPPAPYTETWYEDGTGWVNVAR
jgi:hypothetical protein